MISQTLMEYFLNIPLLQNIERTNCSKNVCAKSVVLFVKHTMYISLFKDTRKACYSAIFVFTLLLNQQNINKH